MLRRSSLNPSSSVSSSSNIRPRSSSEPTKVTGTETSQVTRSSLVDLETVQSSAQDTANKLKNITSENFFSVSEKSNPEHIFDAISTTSFKIPKVDNAFSEKIVKNYTDNQDTNEINKINLEHETKMNEIYKGNGTDEQDKLLQILAERQALSECGENTIGNEAKKPNLWKIGEQACNAGDPVAAWCLHRLMLLENKNAPPPPTFDDHNAGKIDGLGKQVANAPIPPRHNEFDHGGEVITEGINPMNAEGDMEDLLMRLSEKSASQGEVNSSKSSTVNYGEI